MKKVIAGSVLAAGLGIAGLLSAGAASADAVAQPPGQEQATGNTAGAGAGAFGAFGTFGGPRHDMGQGNPNGPGANGPQTGLNNSSLNVGNRQN